jgi:surface carbohydrate biosynthesis protein
MLGKLKMLAFKVPKVEVVILHSNDTLIRSALDEKISVDTLSVLPESGNIYINFQILLSFVCNIIFLNVSNDGNATGVTKFLKRYYIIYLYSVISYMSPRLVITYIDNSNIYQSLVKIDMNRRYLAVQNSVRNLYNVRYAIPEGVTISHDAYLCFGPEVESLYLSNGHEIKEFFFSGGSLKVSEFLAQRQVPIENRPSVKLNLPYDVCVISQWIERNFINNTETMQETSTSIRDATVAMLEELAKVKASKKIKVLVCLRSNKLEEVEFYKFFLGENTSFSAPESKSFHSYEGMLLSNVVVGVSSTLLIEGISLRKKCLWCNLENHPYHRVISSKNDRFITYSRHDFNEKLSFLLMVPANDLETDLSKLKASISPLNSADLPCEKLNRLVNSMLDHHV